MIDRYEAADIARIWSEENKYRKWLDVELAITETWAEMGQVPAASLKNIRENAAVDPARIREIEKKVKHDVIAFLTSLEESIGPDSAYVHKGITSYDVVDTALSLLIRESLAVVLAGCRSWKKFCWKRPSPTRTCRPSAAPMASMPSPSPSAASS